MAQDAGRAAGPLAAGEPKAMSTVPLTSGTTALLLLLRRRARGGRVGLREVRGVPEPRAGHRGGPPVPGSRGTGAQGCHWRGMSYEAVARAADGAAPGGAGAGLSN